ncbi:unnamed protein product [Fraxinus pennsylvanica]|uniref:Uncharacterized protein n=1 Tax=Fraxinus pennsylvanica TaxID=56036 RepID=A0AAD1YNY1_9LAMI|nr:unnamed protein product [Fraxinus pennsylvanica]
MLEKEALNKEENSRRKNFDATLYKNDYTLWTLKSQLSLAQSGQILGSLSIDETLIKEDEEMTKSALSTFRAKEKEIEKKQLEVKKRVQAELGSIQEETQHWV